MFFMDHTTVIHALNRTNNLIEVDDRAKELYKQINSLL